MSYPVGRCAFTLGLAGGLWALGGAVLAAWAWQAAGPGWRQAMGAVLWLAAGAAAVLAWWRAPQGMLVWDGEGWQWAGCAGGVPRVAIDLQRWLLLRLEGGNASWLWLERGSAPHDWDALRRAVYSRASTGAPQGAPPPVAHP